MSGGTATMEAGMPPYPEYDDPRPPKPSVFPPAIDDIPCELSALVRWVGWRYEYRDGKWTKVPKSARGGEAKSQDPATWTDFQTISAAYGQRSTWFDGIGITLGQCSDGQYRVGIDLDSCIDESGQLADW